MVEDAFAAVDAGGRDVAVGHLWKHVPAENATRLASLGDVIPITLPGLRAVVSLGDLLILPGVALVVAGVMCLPGCGLVRGSASSSSRIMVATAARIG